MVSGTAMEERLPARTEQVWAWLAEVPDPEIPAISVVDLGIVREVNWRQEAAGPVCEVVITPTYSGCPATEVIGASIEDALRGHGIDRVRLESRIAPAWTTDWISAEGQRKLLEYGIAPPARRADGRQVIDISGLRRGGDDEPAVACPNCGSLHTRVVSRFGSTPCKALYRCVECLEPFDYFKCH